MLVTMRPNSGVGKYARILTVPLRTVRLTEDRVIEQEPLHLGVDALHALTELPDSAELQEGVRNPEALRAARLAHVVERFQ